MDPVSISASYIVTVALVERVKENIRKMFGEEDAFLAASVSNLDTALRTALATIHGNETRQLTGFSECRETLNTLNDVLEKHKNFCQNEREARKASFQFNFRNGEVADMAGIKAKLIQHTTALSTAISAAADATAQQTNGSELDETHDQMNDYLFKNTTGTHADREPGSRKVPSQQKEGQQSTQIHDHFSQALEPRIEAAPGRIDERRYSTTEHSESSSLFQSMGVEPGQYTQTNPEQLTSSGLDWEEFERDFLGPDRALLRREQEDEHSEDDWYDSEVTIFEEKRSRKDLPRELQERNRIERGGLGLRGLEAESSESEMPREKGEKERLEAETLEYTKNPRRIIHNSNTQAETGFGHESWSNKISQEGIVIATPGGAPLIEVRHGNNTGSFLPPSQQSAWSVEYPASTMAGYPSIAQESVVPLSETPGEHVERNSVPSLTEGSTAPSEISKTITTELVDFFSRDDHLQALLTVVPKTEKNSSIELEDRLPTGRPVIKRNLRA